MVGARRELGPAQNYVTAEAPGANAHLHVANIGFSEAIRTGNASSMAIRSWWTVYFGQHFINGAASQSRLPNSP
ncbi:hypothetical protein Ct61P_12139 [Colletotrichum tofieldiae]|nr:hypothetical protein Ct61P_12139 [Colletotrichum tofieldiae]